MNLKCVLVLVVVFIVFVVAPAYTCDVIKPARTAVEYAAELVRQADSIVIVKALSYTTNVAALKWGSDGEPEPRVRFQVLEVLKGRPLGGELVLPGFLADVDDFNTQQPPYTGVRSGGFRGNCFADEYRRGGIFLLLLKAKGNAAYTARWASLAPINEQVQGKDDPWVLWVRGRLR